MRDWKNESAKTKSSRRVRSLNKASANHVKLLKRMSQKLNLPRIRGSVALEVVHERLRMWPLGNVVVLRIGNVWQRRYDVDRHKHDAPASDPDEDHSFARRACEKYAANELRPA